MEQATAPLAATAVAGAADWHWRGELRMRRAELAALALRHCEVAAFLRFARVPFILRRERALVVGDLRYDREPQLGFAELELDEPPHACPRAVPPWLPPRGELLH
jgi:inner membrane protein